MAELTTDTFAVVPVLLLVAKELVPRRLVEDANEVYVNIREPPDTRSWRSWPDRR